LTPESDLLPLSGLQHLLYCERQAALIHVEGVWVENRFTAEGRVLHERVDERESESRGSVRIARGLPLRSFRLGLVGRADTVELLRIEDGAEGGAAVPGLEGRWRPFPVEHKRGLPKPGAYDEVQLCAQALCLEEMLETSVPEGALFYGRRKRRTVVAFVAELRRRTEEAAARFHALVASGVTPPPVADARCERCSLLPVCLPHAPERSARGFLAASLQAALSDETPAPT
jgi:CRISPR-associated exonuclease Cas4